MKCHLLGKMYYCNLKLISSRDACCPVSAKNGNFKSQT